MDNEEKMDPSILEMFFENGVRINVVNTFLLTLN
jgi:hypothetical protein